MSILHRMTSGGIVRLAFVWAAFVAGNVGWADTLGFSVAQSASSDSLQITVLDELTGQPIPDAIITQGAGLAPAVIEFSDFYGEAQLRAEQGRTLTVSKTGYAAISLMGVPASQITIYLKHLPSTLPEVVASGRVGGWISGLEESEPFSSPAEPSYPTGPADPIIPAGRPVYLGLVMRGLSGFDLLSFSVSSVVSPLYDVIDVWGNRNVPSNLALPRQRIPIFLGSVTVEKYNYRLPVTRSKPTRLSVIQGQIDSGDLIGLAQSGKFTPEAINKMTFDRVGLTPVVAPDAPFTQNIDATLPLSASHNVTVSNPPFESDVLVAGLTDLEGDRQTLVPTDIRAPILQSDRASQAPQVQVSVKSSAQSVGATRGILAVAATRDLKRVSGIVQSQVGATVALGAFLNAGILPDRAALPAQVSFQAPAQGLGLVAFESATAIDDKRSRSFPIWYVYTFPSAGTVTIPTAMRPIADPVRSYALMQLEFNSRFNERVIDGQAAILDLQRFTRSSAKIGE